MDEHSPYAETTLEDRRCGEHEGASAEIRPSQNDHAETVREDKGRDSEMSLAVNSVKCESENKTNVLIRPAALSWYHGAEFVDIRVAQAKESRNPALSEDTNTLSRRILRMISCIPEHN